MLAAPQLASNHDAIDVDVEVLAPLHVALNGSDADGDAITYSVVSITTDNGTIVDVGEYLTAAISAQTNRSLVLNIEERDDMDSVLQTFDPLILQLFDDLVPETTQHFVDLVEAGEYDGDPIHRIVPGFVIQNQGTAPSATTLEDQFSPLLQHTSPGILSLSKPSTDDRGAASFFITDRDTQSLDFNHPVFGFLTSGEDARDAINSLDVETNPNTGELSQPVNNVLIADAEIIHDDQNGVLRLSGLQEVLSGSNSFEVTIRATDANGDFDPSEDLTISIDVMPANDSNRPYLDPIADIHTSADTPVDVQLSYTDIDGGDIFYDLEAVFPGYAPSGDALTGLLTLTPQPGFAGVVTVWPSVSQNPPHSQSPADAQEVPMFITPATPTIELLNNSAFKDSHDNTPRQRTLVPSVQPIAATQGRTVRQPSGSWRKKTTVGGDPVGNPFVIYEGEVDSRATRLRIFHDGRDE